MTTHSQDTDVASSAQRLTHAAGAEMSSSVLLIGANGMLGQAWAQLLANHHITHTVTTRNQLDLTDEDAIERVVTDSFTTVVNCTAWTDVDAAESQYDQALAVNSHAVARLADRCRQIGATLVHYSTDYVFNGQASSPYSIDTLRDPINAYGRSKATGEEAIEASGCRHLIIRTSWLYAPWGKNFVRTIANLVRSKESIKVVNDQHGRPTSCQHLARVSQCMIEKHAHGIYHVTDGGRCTWFEFAQEITRLAGSSCRVEPCDTAEFPRPATRPPYSVLDLSKTESLLGPMPHWKDNLTTVVREMETINS